MRNPNLSVIIKALDKSSSRLARDFGEIENLQNNHFSAIKFANSCYKKIKETLAMELNKIRPEYGMSFTDGDKTTDSADYNYVICPVDGMNNLSRAIPAFTTFIGLEYKKEIIATVINNVANNELYWCEKGSGAFLNNRRIRVSTRGWADNILCNLGNKELADRIKNKAGFRLNNCSSLDIGHLASGRADACLFDLKGEEFLKPLLLIVKEAGGMVSKKEQIIMAHNGKINLD